jgi:hypothetical protein
MKKDGKNKKPQRPQWSRVATKTKNPNIETNP